MPLPLFKSVCHWENIRELGTPGALEVLRSIRSDVVERKRVDCLYLVVAEDLGRALLAAV